MTPLVHLVIGALLGAWLVLSLLNQFRPLAAHFARFDPFGLLPRWTFFAPNPGIHDHHLVFRQAEALLPGADIDDQASPSFGAWSQVEDFAQGRTVPFLWNPGRRLTKTFSDIMSGFLRMRGLGEDFDNVCLFSTEYAWLTHMVEKQVRHPLFQWAVVKTHGPIDNRSVAIVFISRLHNKSP